ncbi:hypothetical protein L226DRAFT_545602 [Lentinus tigrinus ALCF2SS1-7]|uniref:SH3 domain-containing protein n=1 Tax=Lentinus tigrinus ALCF2SS1-6 TaxID=1328759 RepID=A0A5C2SDD9_9APHY|nr:hypothetical protein L227DRAFT_563159 [Lentinus tigrinus ALCF2SS1-6]RPD75258.1 hypothetical protein L226DRAFT_545602 [Lentinus tigrinus ALCF2SS1-7]
MAPHFTFVARDDPTDEDTSINPIIIAGIVVAAVIGVGAALWLGIRWFRKRAASKRKQLRASAFVNFNGSDDSMSEKSPISSAGLPLSGKGIFSRTQLDSGVIMPERAVLRPGASRDEILEHYAAEGKLPRPFAPFAPAAPPPALAVDTSIGPVGAGMLPSGRPSSTSSWLSPVFPLASGRNSRRFSAMSAMSGTSSIGSNGATQKKVRQVFDPVLPDELVVSLGETVTLVQQHDDGWCIVGRDSAFKPGEVELGAVPAWCFLKPVKGLRAERPMRVSSLGVTVNLDAAPGIDHRENVMSWSNF